MRVFHSYVVVAIALTILGIPGSAVAQTIQPPFDASYTLTDLGAVPSLPGPAGGLTFAAGDRDTLLIGGNAETTLGAIYAIGVVRDVEHHITGFSGTATVYASAHGATGGIDGGLAFGPGGVLFFTNYPDNKLGQIKAGSTAPDALVALSSLAPTAIASSVGALAFVPAGVVGAGRLKLVQFISPGNWYDVTLVPDGSGTYAVATVSQITTLNTGPEGVIYVAGGSPQIGADGVLVAEYSVGAVSAYEIDANGDPMVATRRPLVTGLTAPRAPSSTRRRETSSSRPSAAAIT
jgi:hypothetical protein